MTDPVLRNLWITQRYHELALAATRDRRRRGRHVVRIRGLGFEDGRRNDPRRCPTGQGAAARRRQRGDADGAPCPWPRCDRPRVDACSSPTSLWLGPRTGHRRCGEGDRRGERAGVRRVGPPLHHARRGPPVGDGTRPAVVVGRVDPDASAPCRALASTRLPWRRHSMPTRQALTSSPDRAAVVLRPTPWPWRTNSSGCNRQSSVRSTPPSPTP